MDDRDWRSHISRIRASKTIAVGVVVLKIEKCALRVYHRYFGEQKKKLLVTAARTHADIETSCSHSRSVKDDKRHIGDCLSRFIDIFFYSIFIVISFSINSDSLATFFLFSSFFLPLFSCLFRRKSSLLAHQNGDKMRTGNASHPSRQRQTFVRRRRRNGVKKRISRLRSSCFYFIFLMWWCLLCVSHKQRRRARANEDSYVEALGFQRRSMSWQAF